MEAPLQNYVIVGFTIRETAVPGGPSNPGGSCWHCGQAIKNCVAIQNLTTGEVHEVGVDCAKRVGLSESDLKAMFARYRDEEHTKKASTRKAQTDAELGAHGTLERFNNGCRCQICVAVSPHGTMARFVILECRCMECIGEAITPREDGSQGYKIIEDWDVLVDLESGKLANAKVVNTRYGTSWCVDDGKAWVGYEPARRSTQTKKGYVQAQTPYLVSVHGNRSNTWCEPVYPMGSPLVDIYNEPLPRPN